MKQIAPILPLIVALLSLTGCLTTGYASPFLTEPGKLTLGIHTGIAFGHEGTYDSPLEEFFGPFLLNGVLSFGIAPRREISVKTGSSGFSGLFKYSFGESSDTWRIAAAVGSDMLMWKIPALSLGVLGGYRFGGKIEINGGVRHFIAVDRQIIPAVLVSSGLEIFPGSPVSFTGEASLFLPYRGGSGIIENKRYGFGTAGAGVRFSF